MDSEIEITSEIAECVGLWLAEGDSKTLREITFTNNCFPLVKFFANKIEEIFVDSNLRPRIYVYSAKKVSIQIPMNYRINYYSDKRARYPYFLFRVSSVKVVRQWKNLIEVVKYNKKFYTSILRGFFAGEGNIKGGIHSVRAIRIAQGKPNKFIERILKYHGISYRFSYHERAYVITGKWNWDILANIKIADLHPLKKEKFWRLYNSYKEIHYPGNWLRNNILKLLEKPYSSLSLSKRFNRSQARIQDILIPLKKEGIVQSFNVRSKSYWIKSDQNKIIISKIKEKYLKSLKRKEKSTAELAKEIGVCWKAAYRRLTELQKLNLVIQNLTGTWKLLSSDKEVIIL